MHYTYIGQLVWPVAAPLIVRMRSCQRDVTIVRGYPFPALQQISRHQHIGTISSGQLQAINGLKGNIFGIRFSHRHMHIFREPQFYYILLFMYRSGTLLEVQFRANACVIFFIQFYSTMCRSVFIFQYVSFVLRTNSLCDNDNQTGIGTKQFYFYKYCTSPGLKVATTRQCAYLH